MTFIRTLAAATLGILATGCTQITLDWAKMKPVDDPAAPEVLSSLATNPPVRTVSEWQEQRRPLIQDILQKEIYGTLPASETTQLLSHRVIDKAAFGGRATFEEFRVEVTPSFSNGNSGDFIVAVVTPNNADGPLPLIMMQSFCPRWDAVPHPDATAPEGEKPGEQIPGVFRFVFGRFVCTPPLEDITKAGYAVALVNPGELVPDQGDAGLAALKRLSIAHTDDATRWGAIAAWGWTFSRVIDVLADDPRFDQDKIIAYGHSRFGKSALLAAAYDDRVDGVIAHQSGTGGASLNRRKKGESVKAITDSYPHWFSSSYASYAGREEELTLDQHHLLALVAPRPIMLGNARRDVWSDPNGAFRAAQGASPVYELYGADGFTPTRLDQFEPDQPLSFWLRPGTHGVVKEDWPAFLAFLDAHFKD